MPTMLQVDSESLESFEGFLKVNRRLEDTTIKATLQDVRRLLRMSDFIVSYENVRAYLTTYTQKAPKTYNTQITSLRRFIRDFLKLPDLIMSFKMAPVDECMWRDDLPSKNQVRKGFLGLEDVRSKAIYLFIASTGLRKNEILRLQKNQINSESHAVIPKHFTRKKRSGITFYNDEASEWLEKYLCDRKDDSAGLFVISDRKWKKIWTQASDSAGTRLTSKILRAWVSTELGELGVPDRFVDVFQGRAPRSVLARHYTGKGLERLKRIYEKAQLKILTK